MSLSVAFPHWSGSAGPVLPFSSCWQAPSRSLSGFTQLLRYILLYGGVKQKITRSEGGLEQTHLVCWCFAPCLPFNGIPCFLSSCRSFHAVVSMLGLCVILFSFLRALLSFDWSLQFSLISCLACIYPTCPQMFLPAGSCTEVLTLLWGTQHLWNSPPIANSRVWAVAAGLKKNIPVPSTVWSWWLCWWAAPEALLLFRRVVFFFLPTLLTGVLLRLSWRPGEQHLGCRAAGRAPLAASATYTPCPALLPGQQETSDLPGP